MIYDLPSGQGTRFFSGTNGFTQKLIGGWQIATLGQFRSGIAGTVYIPLSQTGNGDYINQRPNVVSGVNIYPTVQSVNLWLNPSAFAEPAAGTFGNAGRGIFFGPKLANVDFSVIKNTKITERLRMQIRGEFFNVLNHPNFAEPNETVGASFGEIFNTLGRTIGFGTSRQIQLSARFNF
jgi:hypothetical protein